jgi:N-acetylglucosamine repressor
MDNNPKPTISFINQQRVLYLLRTHGPLSRAEVSRQSGLTKATISKIVDRLEKNNIIERIGHGDNARGRKSVLYSYNASSALAVGVEVRQEDLRGVVTQMDANPLKSYSIPMRSTHVEEVIAGIMRILESVRNEFNNPIVGIGIGVPGVCDKQREMVIYSERLNWKMVPLVALIHQHSDLEVSVENRGNAAVLGEFWLGAGQDIESLIFIHIGSGIKAGIVLNGELYIGGNGSAGEIGHIVIAHDGPLCVCGKRGCLEALASTTAMTNYAHWMIQNGQAEDLASKLGDRVEHLTIDDVLEMAKLEDGIALKVLKESAEYIGTAVAILINAFNPRRVIIGDFANQAPPIFLETVRETAFQQSFKVPWEGVEIVTSKLGYQSVVIGAAALMLSKDFQLMQARALINGIMP